MPVTEPYPNLSSEEKASFSAWLSEQGYSATYSHAIAYFHYNGVLPSATPERARVLFDSWLADDTSTCRPTGPLGTREPAEADELTTAETAECECESEIPWSLVTHALGMDISDDQKKSLILKILE